MDTQRSSTPALQIVMVVVVALCVVALVAFARGEPGDGGRAPDATSSVSHSGGGG